MKVSAIVLAAGRSVRMGQPKMLMPWGETTVLGRVIQTIRAAGIEDIVLVTNSEIAGRITNDDLHIVLNDDGEMLTSLQCGLRALLGSPSSILPGQDGKGQAEAALICLGDQPQVREGSVRLVCEAFQETKSNLVVPSYHMRRGHPWLAARALWDEILSMREPATMRDFLNRHNAEILYVESGTPAILQDLDTPDDYLKHKPR
ncbi:MAG: hypothetical protein DPW18_06040 [Chloroflexi bacterium]|nr:hypothetical protein [Chloroflexota bacterium]